MKVAQGAWLPVRTSFTADGGIWQGENVHEESMVLESENIGFARPLQRSYIQPVEPR